MENPGKETYVEQMERVNQTNPFMLHNRIRAVALSEDRAEVRAEITEDSLNAMQTVHGGLMFVMAEVAAGLVTRNDGRKYVTLDSSFRFLRGSSAKNIQGLARKERLLYKSRGRGDRYRETPGRRRIYVLLYG